MPYYTLDSPGASRSVSTHTADHEAPGPFLGSGCRSSPTTAALRRSGRRAGIGCLADIQSRSPTRPCGPRSRVLVRRIQWPPLGIRPPHIDLAGPVCPCASGSEPFARPNPLLNAAAPVMRVAVRSVRVAGSAASGRPPSVLILRTVSHHVLSRRRRRRSLMPTAARRQRHHISLRRYRPARRGFPC